jgi:uncharacterized protein
MWRRNDVANHHGDFTWYELITPDPDGAQAFYGPLLGWTFTNSSFADRDYRYAAVGSEGIAGVLKTPDGLPMPPAWLGYVGVDDVDKMVDAVTHAGGTVHRPAFERERVGRMALLGDPQGALFYVIKNGSDESHAFSWDAPRHGYCAWNELATRDVEAAKHFYKARFGWVADGGIDMGPMGQYTFLRHAGRAPDGSPPGYGMLGAVYPKAAEDDQSHWLFYFRVPDIDAALAQIEIAGGRLHQPPTPIPGGDFSLIAADPQGAYFGLVGSRTA